MRIGVRIAPGQSTDTCTPWRSASSRNDLRDRDDGMFGGGVARRTGSGDETGHGGCVHDVTGVLADHDRIDRLDAVYHTAQVHVEDIVPVIERVFVDLTADPNAGIVEQIVDPPGLLHRLGDGALERWEAAHIELDRVRLCATAVEALRQLLRRVDLTIGDPDLGAPVDQLVANAAPMPDAPPVTNAIFPDTLDAMGKDNRSPRRSHEILAADRRDGW